MPEGADEVRTNGKRKCWPCYSMTRREERSNKRSSYLQIPARSSPRFTPVRSVQGRVQQRGLRRAKARISQGKERLIGNDGLSLKK